MSDSDSEELYLEDEWSEGNDDFLIDEYLDEMAIEGDWFTHSEDGEEEVELDQEYQFFNEFGRPGTLYTKEEMKEWVQDAMALETS